MTDLYDFLDPIFKVEPALFVIVAEVAHGRKPVLGEVVGVGSRVVEVTLSRSHSHHHHHHHHHHFTFMQVMVLTQISPSSPGPSLCPEPVSRTQALLPGVSAPRHPELTSNVQDTLPV